VLLSQSLSDTVTETKPDFRAGFLAGVAHFNAGEFWEAHESWEELWLAAESDIVQFLQGMIQLAAAYHHLQRGTLRGGVRLFDAALKRLAAFPPDFCAIDRRPLEVAAAGHRLWAAARLRDPGAGPGEAMQRLDGDAFPVIHLIAEVSLLLPPRADW
jgi:predicted metal-dependent hydrolase